MRFTMPLIALALLVGCGQSEGQGGLTAEEERQLDNAAQMLDDNMIEFPPESLVASESDLDSMEMPVGNGAENEKLR